jgi:hypothetical protein
VCVGSCLPGGASCTADGQCCAGTCNAGVCATPCDSNGASCTADGQCCGGSCIDGTCGGSCLLDGASCSASYECCIGSCADGACTCQEDGAPCAANSDCCIGICTDGACTGAGCIANGSACTIPSDCCADACTNGLCGACSGAELCFDWYLSGGTYDELCGAAKKAVDPLISCLCNACGSSCSSCTTNLQAHGVESNPDPTCNQCVSSAAMGICLTQTADCTTN